MKWYFGALRKYATFKGRARRKEYWSFVFLNPLVLCATALVTAAIGILGHRALSGLINDGIADDGMMLLGMCFGSVVYSLFVLIPSIAVAVRRMHDAGRSGWWLFMPLINFILLCRGSQPHDNRYGPNPIGAEPLRSVVQAA
jgi:uncharacterized membrane protein YhaH (DUF805 family)